MGEVGISFTKNFGSLLQSSLWFFFFGQIKSPQKFQEQYEVDEVLYVDQIQQYLKGPTQYYEIS
jgi:hypothetical protein